MKELSLEQQQEVDGGIIGCGEVAGAGTAAGAAAYITGKMAAGARLGAFGGPKALIAGAAVGLLAGGMCLAFSE